MKKLAAMFIMLFLVSGCGSYGYYNINPTRHNQASWEQDSSYCNAVAVGSVTMPNNPQTPAFTQSYTTGSGTITDSRGNMYMGSYNQMTTHTNPAAAGQALTNLGNQLEATGARMTIYNHCISQHGWRKISKQEYDAMNSGQANTQNYQLQAQSFQKAAEQGNAEASANLGFMYANGQGVPKDEAKAVYWYQKAAEQGNAWALYNLGEMYRDGSGVPQDYTKAVQFLQKAAEQGYPVAQDELKKTLEMMK